MQNETLFLVIFDSRSSIVKSVFDGRLSGVLMNIFRFSLTKLLSQLDFLRLTILDQIKMGPMEFSIKLKIIVRMVHEIY